MSDLSSRSELRTGRNGNQPEGHVLRGASSALGSVRCVRSTCARIRDVGGWAAAALLIASTAAIGAATSGCGLWPFLQNSKPADEIRSSKTRELSPAVGSADLTELVTGNNGFAFGLYHAVGAQGVNLICSPYSISLALAMTYAGAANQTEQQMAQTLQFTLPQDRLHPAFDALDLELASRSKLAASKDSDGFRLKVANALWAQKDYPFLAQFLDMLAVNYGAGLMGADFAADPEKARLTINAWVSDQTEQRIRDLIAPGLITDLTRLVIANAVYFKAAWESQFKDTDTQSGVFHLPDSTDATVPMMRQRENLRYAQGEGFRCVELPYVGGKVSMVILIPDAGQFEEFEGALDEQKLASIINSLSLYDVLLTMPKFTFSTELALADTLAAMGMPDAFDSQVADFSGMIGRRELFIGHVCHKAFILVDEKGTEAAAATAVIIGVTSVPEPRPYVELRLDRPFIFLIRDVPTGTILFMGRVMDPRG
jgi:serpin B